MKELFVYPLSGNISLSLCRHVVLLSYDHSLTLNKLIKHDILLATKQYWTNQNSAESIRMLFVSFCFKSTFSWLCGRRGGLMVSALVPEWVVWVRTLAGDIVLCSWARHLTLTVPVSTQVYKWLPVNCWGKPNKMRGNDLRWTSILSKGSRNTPSRFMLQKPGISSGSYGPVGSKGFIFFPDFRQSLWIVYFSKFKRSKLINIHIVMKKKRD